MTEVGLIEFLEDPRPFNGVFIQEALLLQGSVRQGDEVWGMKVQGVYDISPGRKLVLLPLSEIGRGSFLGVER